MNSLKKNTLAYIKKIFHHRKTSQEAVSYDFTNEGINYVIMSTENMEVKVVANANKYSGNIVIPTMVNFRGRMMNVTRVSRYAFFHCHNLKSVDLGGVKQIGNRAFEGCINLKHLNLKEVEVIGKHAFEGCSSLISIDFNKVKTIERKAFYGCTNIESLDFMNVKSIGDENFVGCKNLTSINFRNVTSLGNSVFEECSNLSSLYLRNIECLKGIYVLDEYSKKGVFKNCTNLQTVSLDNVQEIHDCAFFGCPNITVLRTRCSIPPYIEPKAFHSYVYLSTLYVPKGSLELYQKHDIWNKFIIEEYED